MRYWRLVLGLVVLVGLVVALNSLFFREPEPPTPPPSHPAPSSKVAIEAFLPIKVGCHGPTIKMLNSLVAANRGRVTLKLYDLGDKKRSGPRIKQLGLGCATVLVNRQHAFTLQGKNGKPRQVNFQGPRGQNYTPEDVKAVVMQELRKPTPAGPPEMPTLPPGKR